MCFAGESLSVREGIQLPSQTTCSRCGHVSSQEVCKACVLLEGLNKGLPKLGTGKSSKAKEARSQLVYDESEGEPKKGDCTNCSCSKKKEGNTEARFKDIEEILGENKLNGNKESCKKINKIKTKKIDLTF